MKCRHCHQPLSHTFIDLATAPPSNSYLNEAELLSPEKWYPLKVLVCDQCWLVQTQDFVQADEMFSEDYAYFSSCSSSWLAHAQQYVSQMTARFALNDNHTIVEIAANDGYLLQYVKAQQIPCYGIEPTHSTASAAREKGIDIVENFFTVELAKQLAEQNRCADLIAANNVLAHVPDINDFTQAFSILLKPNGVATFEFPHLVNLIEQCQFDTIYHEHYSYLSLTTVNTLFAKNGLSVFDVETLPSHGGSLRVFAQRRDSGQHDVQPAVAQLLNQEKQLGLLDLAYYTKLQPQAEQKKYDLLQFLLNIKKDGKKAAAYGAAAKGNTMLNFTGIRNDLIPYVVDRNPAKQGQYLPGSRIAIVDENHLKLDRPDYVILIPWNLKQELIEQLSYIREWGGKFVVYMPELETL